MTQIPHPEIAADKSFALLSYDIPVSRRSVYGKLRNKVTRWGIQMTQSCYLIKWGMKDTALGILKELDEDPNTTDRIVYSCLKFDNSEQAALEEAASAGLRRLIKGIQDYMYDRMQKSVILFEENKYSRAECRDAQRLTLARAKDRIQKAQCLSVLFEIHDSVDDVVMQICSYIEKHRKEIKDEVKKEVEAAKKQGTPQPIWEEESDGGTESTLSTGEHQGVSGEGQASVR